MPALHRLGQHEAMTEQPNPQQRPPLRRSSTDRVIGGVCGGLAHTLGVDPVIVRVITAVLAILGGAGIAAYIIAWILIPNDQGESALDQSRAGRGRFPQFVLVLLLAIAAVSIFHTAWPGSNDGLGFLVFILVAVVAWQAFGSDWFTQTTVVHNADAAGRTVTVEKGADGQTVTLQSPAGTTVIRKEPRSALGRIVWNLLAVVVGAMLALNWSGYTDISARMMIVIALAIVGLGLVVSSFAGRARGLIALGLLLAVLTAPAGIHVDGSTGTRTWAPITSATDTTRVTYKLGAGDATLDLREFVAGMPAGSFRDVTVELGAGTLKVLVPSGDAAHFMIQSDVGVGEISFPGRGPLSGVGQSVNEELGAPADSALARTIQLRLKVGVGSVEVRYA